MFYHLVIAAAVIFSLLLVISYFYGDFPFFNYDDDVTQAVCRMLLVFCTVLFLVAAVMYPEVMICPYGEGRWLFNIFIAVADMAIMLIFEFFYWIGSTAVICIIAYIWHLCKKLAGWVFKGDPWYFLPDDD